MFKIIITKKYLIKNNKIKLKTLDNHINNLTQLYQCNVLSWSVTFCLAKNK